MAKPKVTAGDIVQALREDYGLAGNELVMEEWSLLTEVPLLTMETQQGITTWRRRNERTIDVLLCRNWSSGKTGYDRLALEVKVSRADYRNETDSKRAPAWANAHRCAYAVPAGLITVEELPDGWGLLYVHPEPFKPDARIGDRDYGKRCQWVRKATRHEPDGDLTRLAHTLARRASRAEERIRRGGEDAAEVAALRAEVKRLHARLGNRDGAIDRQRERANEALRRLRALGEQRCADCQEVVKVAPPGARATYNTREDGFWSHADEEQGNRCRMARSEAERARREAATGSRYTGGLSYALPVETVDERAEREREWQATRAEDDAYRELTTDADRAEEWRYAG